MFVKKPWAAGLLLLALVLSATAQAQTTTWRYDYKGSSASLHCSSYDPETGVTSFLSLDAFESTSKSSGTKPTTGSPAFLYISQWRFDPVTGEYLGDWYAWGPADAGSVSLDGNKGLAKFRLSATFTSLESGAYGVYGPEPPALGPVVVDNLIFTGTGDISKGTYRYTYSSGAFRYVSSYTGSWRSATVNGGAITGLPFDLSAMDCTAQIRYTTSGSLSITRQE